MSRDSHTEAQAAIVSAQIGRVPREPWRVSALCRYGYAMAIVSPCRLEDGTPFPDFAWLTCPFLVAACSAEESKGASAMWAARAESEPEVAEQLRRIDRDVQAARAAESGGVDECAHLGAAGQRDACGVKCVHAHVALRVSGIDDVIGAWVIERHGDACADERCARYEIGNVSEDNE